MKETRTGSFSKSQTPGSPTKSHTITSKKSISMTSTATYDSRCLALPILENYSAINKLNKSELYPCLETLESNYPNIPLSVFNATLQSENDTLFCTNLTYSGTWNATAIKCNVTKCMVFGSTTPYRMTWPANITSQAACNSFTPWCSAAQEIPEDDLYRSLLLLKKYSATNALNRSELYPFLANGTLQPYYDSSVNLSTFNTSLQTAPNTDFCSVLSFTCQNVGCVPEVVGMPTSQCNCTRTNQFGNSINVTYVNTCAEPPIGTCASAAQNLIGSLACSKIFYPPWP